MRKSYKAVPMPGCKVGVLALLAETDFEALGKAKQHFGAEIPFELWNGTRLALAYKPVAATALTSASSNHPDGSAS